MSTEKQHIRKIKNLSDLKRYKRRLHRKIFIREKLLNKHIKDFNKDFSGYYLAEESVKLLKLEGSFWQFLPKLFSQNSLKNILLPLISGVGTGLGSIFMFKNKNQKKTTSNKKQNYPYQEDNLFV